MQKLWSNIQTLLVSQLDSGHYKVWIAPLQAELSGDKTNSSLCLKLFAPTDYVAQRVRERYSTAIAKAAEIVLGHDLKLEICAGNATSPLPAAEINTSQPTTHAASADEQTDQVGLPISFKDQASAGHKYSFDTFIVGPSNELAFTAARSLCTQTQLDVNTLFLASGPGLGKTHLIHSIGHFLKTDARAGCRVECLTAEEFGSRMIAAIRARETDRFKARYRDIDLLLLEDIHFLQGKEKMQDEVLSTIKSIRDRGGRVVFSSSFLPQDLKDLDSQLASRFTSGFFAMIKPPCFETRKNIFKSKAKTHQVLLPEAVAELLAEHVHNDVRKIESCLHNLILHARLLNQEISLSLACTVLEQFAEHTHVIDFDSIIRTVCRAFGLSSEEIASKTRRANYVSARNAIFFLARKHTPLTLAEIGQRFNRTHTSVIKGIAALEREINRGTPLGMQLNNTLALIEKNSHII